MFNHLGLTDLALSKGYHLYYKTWQPGILPDDEKVVASVSLRVLSPNQEIIFYVHAYLREDVTIGASGMLDPMAILMQKQVNLHRPEAHLPSLDSETL